MRKDNEDALDDARRYFSIIMQKLITETGADIEQSRRLLNSIARREMTLASIGRFVSDVNYYGVKSPVTPGVIAKQVNVLEANNWLDGLDSFALHGRSASAMQTPPKIRFVDPSISCRAMSISSPETMISDLRTMGLAFESLCIRDLKVYSQSFNGAVTHYRDKDGSEIDAIVSDDLGHWAALEIKLGEEQLDAAAAKLNAAVDRICGTGRIGDPAAKAIIVGLGGKAYRRTDGVLVVPVVCLGE